VTTPQLSLFDAVSVDVIKSPMCHREPHCGGTAQLGPEQDRGSCINRLLTCLRCGVTGEQSTRKDMQ
jgi:hypothetical protein